MDLVTSKLNDTNMKICFSNGERWLILTFRLFLHFNQETIQCLCVISKDEWIGKTYLEPQDKCLAIKSPGETEEIREFCSLKKTLMIIINVRINLSEYLLY